jgi:hypothetical protein
VLNLAGPLIPPEVGHRNHLTRWWHGGAQIVLVCSSNICILYRLKIHMMALWLFKPIKSQNQVRYFSWREGSYNQLVVNSLYRTIYRSSLNYPRAEATRVTIYKFLVSKIKMAVQFLFNQRHNWSRYFV